MRHRYLAAIALIAAVTPLSAQTGSAQPGTIVRATLAASDPLIGTLVSRTSDSLTIVLRGKESIVRISNASVQSLEVVNGKRRLEPALRWGAIGGGVWAVVAMVVPYDNCAVRHTEYCANSRAQFVASQAISVAVAGAAIGAWRGEDRWVRVEGASAAPFVARAGRGAVVGMQIKR